MTLDEALRELDELVLDRVRAGLCGCGCGEALPIPYRGRGRNRQPIPFEDGRRRFIDSRHRQRVYHRRVELAAEASGAPTRLSLRGLQAATGTSKRHSDAPGAAQAGQARKRRAPRPGLSVYFPTVRDAELVREVVEAARYVGGVPAIEALDRALERRARREARA